MGSAAVLPTACAAPGAPLPADVTDTPARKRSRAFWNVFIVTAEQAARSLQSSGEIFLNEASSPARVQSASKRSEDAPTQYLSFMNNAG
jgi:hypothetical protein